MKANQLRIRKKLIQQLFNFSNGYSFEEIALAIFNYQTEYNPVYKKYLSFLRIDSRNIKSLPEIPFLPVEVYRNQKVVAFTGKAALVFRSSGTLNSSRSAHYVFEPALYEKSLLKGFQHFYGDPADYVFYALLPNYMEQGDSSLIYMVRKLMEVSKQPEEYFYLINYGELEKRLRVNRKNNKKVFLIGVAYALLDFAKQFQIDAGNAIIMETGGMKGRKKEIVREELHNCLKKSFNVSEIHSEYGMTELMSQTYSQNAGLYATPPWMKILIRDLQDPLTYIKNHKQGGINIIDLANIDSCSFIATSDIGVLHQSSEKFEVLGRMDNSEIRGCNLLIH